MVYNAAQQATTTFSVNCGVRGSSARLLMFFVKTVLKRNTLMYAVELRNVTKVYRKGLRGVKVPAVTSLSLTINKERITGFVGPNGAGKTNILSHEVEARTFGSRTSRPRRRGVRRPTHLV